MTTPSSSLALPALFLGSLITFSLAGCSLPPRTLANYQEDYRYEPMRVTETLPRTASIEIRQTMNPALQEVWANLVKYGHNQELSKTASQEMLSRDLAESGLFAATVPAGSAADYRVILDKGDVKDGDNYQWNLKLSLFEGSGGRLLFSREVQHRWVPELEVNHWKQTMPRLMMVLKSGVLEYAHSERQAQRKREEEQSMRALPSMKLEELLAGSDTSVAFARERNRTIVAAKTTQLPALLRDTRTDELSALVVRIEQTIPDLNHEGEVAKDRAQQILAAGAGASPAVSADDLRDLAISYRERIELLKPIAAAIKEELSNRNR